MRDFHYNHIPFGTLPVLKSEEYGVETVTGTVDPVQEQYIKVIESTTSIPQLSNYMIQFPEVFFRTSKIQFFLEYLISNRYDTDYISIADVVSYFADMFIVSDGCVMQRFPI